VVTNSEEGRWCGGFSSCRVDLAIGEKNASAPSNVVHGEERRVHNPVAGKTGRADSGSGEIDAPLTRSSQEAGTIDDPDWNLTLDMDLDGDGVPERVATLTFAVPAGTESERCVTVTRRLASGERLLKYCPEDSDPGEPSAHY
jgi:hypothetical protein